MISSVSIRASELGAVSVDEFAGLNNEDQVALIGEYVLDWKVRVGNASVNYQADLSAREFDVKTRVATNTLVQRVARREWELKRIDNSYLLFHKKSGWDNPENEHIGSEDFAAYNAMSGRRRSFSNFSGDRQDWAAIGPEHTQILHDCQMMALIGASIELVPEVSLLDFTTRFLRAKDNASVYGIDSSAGAVKLQFPIKMFGKDAVCTQAYLLGRPGLPFSEQIIVYDNSDNERFRYTTGLSEFSLRDGVWFPDFVVMEAWSNRRPEVVTVHELKVLEVSFNALHLEDLEIKFPPGTEVQDEYTGEVYRVGTDGGRVASRFAEENLIPLVVSDGVSFKRIFFLVSMSLVGVALFLFFHLRRAPGNRES